jgi:hypothetical protein
LKPDVVAGWGSLEQLEPTTGCDDYGIAVFGLAILRNDDWNMFKTVTHVLLLQHISGQSYRRLGAGMIFDQVIALSLLQSETEDIVLH